ncbi:MAG: hypothetical protein H6739_11605 [Alphaproteobacteria bacterium]|nr:hypothetical protein [Alphaproteobacteria bacterium]
MWLDFAVLVAVQVALLALLVEGIGLISGWRWLHTLGIPIRSGMEELPAPLESDLPLPNAPKGDIALWLDEDHLAWWSGRVRVGFRDTIGFSAFRGMGVTCTGSGRLSDDRTTLYWTERVRLSPPFLALAVGLMGSFLWDTEVGGAILWLPPLGLLAFYGVFLGISLVVLSGTRRRVFGVLRGVL